MSARIEAPILRIQTKIIFKTLILSLLSGIILSLFLSPDVIAQSLESESNQATTTERTTEENPTQPARGVDEQGPEPPIPPRFERP